MSHPPKTSAPKLHISEIVNESNALLAGITNPDKRILAIGIEINQRYVDYLDELEDALINGHIRIESGVTVALDGRTIKFKDTHDFSNWLSEHTT